MEPGLTNVRWHISSLSRIMRKVHVPTAAQGIEDDAAVGFDVAPGSDGTMRVTRPRPCGSPLTG